jgi:signal transduction histidine kinase
VLPVLLAFIELGGTVGAQQNQEGIRQLNALGVFLLLAAPACLLLRRRHPVPTLVAVAVLVEAYLQWHFPWGPFMLSLIAAMLNAVMRGHRGAAWTLTAGLYAADAAILAGRGESMRSWQTLVILAAVLTLALVVGEAARVTRERAIEVTRAASEARLRQASDERLRIARELHDVLAHNISLINVQAGVALHLMDGDPEQARTALTAIRQASKDVLGELRAALGVLRGDGESAPRSPTPDLARLPELIEQVRGAGLAVRTRIGDLPDLPAPVELAAFRIVQEALTNVRRHAGTATATVTIEYAGGTLTVRVDDDGAGSAATAEPGSGTATGSTGSGGTGSGGTGSGGTDSAGGSGIAGMRERAIALGGTLTAGPHGHGFRVEARLPVAVPAVPTATAVPTAPTATAP